MFMLSILVYLFIFPSGYAEEWLDPNDMINFDHSTMSNVNSKPKVKEPDQFLSDIPVLETPAPEPENSQPSNPKEKSILDEVTQQTTKAYGNIANFINDAVTSPKSEGKAKDTKISLPKKEKKNATVIAQERKKKAIGQDKIFYKIFMKKVLLLWQNKHLTEKPTNFHSIVRMSSTDLARLQKYVSDESHDINDAHDAISQMIVRIRDEEETGPSAFEQPVDFFKQYTHLVNWGILVILGVMCSIQVIRLRVSISITQVILKLTILAIIVSVPMQWYHMYKEMEAKQASFVDKPRPVSCTPEKMTSWEVAKDSLKSMFTTRTKDPCIEYYEQMTINPIFKVSIIEALSLTIVNLFITPFGHIGTAFGKFVNQMLAEVSPILWPVPILLIIMAMFVLTGYSIRVPFLLSIESPWSGRSRTSGQDTKKLEAIENRMSTMMELLHQRPTSQPIQLVYPPMYDHGDGPPQIGHQVTGSVDTIGPRNSAGSATGRNDEFTWNSATRDNKPAEGLLHRSRNVPNQDTLHDVDDGREVRAIMPSANVSSSADVIYPTHTRTTDENLQNQSTRNSNEASAISCDTNEDDYPSKGGDRPKLPASSHVTSSVDAIGPLADNTPAVISNESLPRSPNKRNSSRRDLDQDPVPDHSPDHVADPALIGTNEIASADSHVTSTMDVIGEGVKAGPNTTDSGVGLIGAMSDDAMTPDIAPDNPFIPTKNSPDKNDSDSDLEILDESLEGMRDNPPIETIGRQISVNPFEMVDNPNEFTDSSPEIIDACESVAFCEKTD